MAHHILGTTRRKLSPSTSSLRKTSTRSSRKHSIRCSRVPHVSAGPLSSPWSLCPRSPPKWIWKCC
jgi:hypothetical protein